MLEYLWSTGSCIQVCGVRLCGASQRAKRAHKIAVSDCGVKNKRATCSQGCGFGNAARTRAGVSGGSFFSCPQRVNG